MFPIDTGLSINQNENGVSKIFRWKIIVRTNMILQQPSMYQQIGKHRRNERYMHLSRNFFTWCQVWSILLTLQSQPLPQNLPSTYNWTSFDDCHQLPPHAPSVSLTHITLVTLEAAYDLKAHRHPCSPTKWPRRAELHVHEYDLRCLWDEVLNHLQSGPAKRY